MKAIKENRGGKRAGAGRKAPGGVRVNFTTKIAPATRARIDKLKAHGVTIGPLLDDLVADLCLAHSIE